MAQTSNIKSFQAVTRDLTTGALPSGAVPYIRENSLRFSADSLRPHLTANLFFDAISVNGYSQKASILYADKNAYTTTLVKTGDSLLGASSYAYGEIIASERRVGGRVKYFLDTNFLTFKVTKVTGDPTDFSDTQFAVDDIIYQTTDGAVYTYSNGNQNYSFYGKVKRWKKIDNSTGILVVDPYEGRANTFLDVSSAGSYIRCDKYSNPVNAVALFSNNKFQASENILLYNDTVLTTVDSAGYHSDWDYLGESVASFFGYSGVVPTVNVGNSKSIVISSNNLTRDGLTNLVGNNVYIVAGSGQGFMSRIDSVVDFKYGSNAHYKELILANTLSTTLQSNSVYSLREHITDDRGSVAGIFHVVSDASTRWPCGTRIFTITDSNDPKGTNYRMKATAGFVASLETNTAENARNPVTTMQKDSPVSAASTGDIVGSYAVNDRRYMSQTFFTPKKNEIVNGVLNTSYGIFVSSIDLFFHSKPTTDGDLLPFSVAITKVENGLPIDIVIAECSLDQETINVSSYIDATGNTVPGVPTTSNVSTMTKFTFNDPVYLAPDSEYAIRLHTESTDYQVWTAQIGSLVADASGNDRRVSDQPYVGSFFTAQNASNWNPIENQDLMFRVNKAIFNASSSFTMKVDPGYVKTNTFADMVKLVSAEQQFTPTHVRYLLDSKKIDNTSANQVEIKNTEIYNFGADVDISSTDSKRRRLIKQNDGEDMTLTVQLTTSDTAVAPILNKERMALFAIQNIINNAGLTSGLIQIINGGTGYDSGTTTVTISAPNDDYGVQATAQAVISGGVITGITILEPGAGYYETPTITITSTGSGTGAIATLNGETDNMGGNILTKYQTKVVTLEDGFESGDLIVRLEAYRPYGTDIQVYFKVLSAQDSDGFIDKTWKRMTKMADVYSPNLGDKINLEYRFDASTGLIQYIQDGNSYPLGGEFKFFAIKLRLVARDPSVVPGVDALKVIAVPGG